MDEVNDSISREDRKYKKDTHGTSGGCFTAFAKPTGIQNYYNVNLVIFFPLECQLEIKKIQLKSESYKLIIFN